MDVIWKKISVVDQRMTDEAPFRLVKTDRDAGKAIIAELAAEVYQIGHLLLPFMPTTSAAITDTVRANTKPEALFPRIEA